ncbi:hypothetical protein [Cellulomonas sp. Y8]|uniref:hypothetical protein n=1 Tax=Cellulomonas sp. Y8 TaxID=2591145 RepID=UPI0011C8A5BA|nr:hypothetical protein [Cellulomonas sp. Y8]
MTLEQERAPVPAEFRDVARHLRKMSTAISSYVHVDGALAAHGSPAHQDKQNSTFDGAWGHPTARLAANVGGQLVGSADHLVGLAVLITEPRAVMSIASLVRPSVEQAAVTYWLYAPRIDVRDRVRRLTNLQLQSLTEQQNALMSVAGHRDQTAGATVLAIKSSAERLEFRWVRPKNRRARAGFLQTPHLDEPLPTERFLFSDLFGEAGTDPDDIIGRVTQFLTSAVLHARPHGTTAFVLNVGPSSDPTVASATLGLSAEMFANLIGAVVLANDIMMTRLIEHFGWRDGPWRRAVLPAYLAVRPLLPGTPPWEAISPSLRR